MSKKLLTFLTLLTLFFGVGWAATATYSLTPNQANTGTSSTSYITSLTEFTYNQVSWKMTQWNPSSLQIKTNQDKPASQFRFYNTSAFSGKITKVVITFSALTVADASKLMFIGGTSEVSGTTGGTAGTWNATNKTLTWEPSASDEFTFFGFYQNGKAATGTNKLAITDAIVVTYETGGSTSTTYDIDVTNGSADPNPAAEGAIVTLTPTIPDGKVIDWENTTVSPSTVVINHDDYTFTMPGEAVTVSFAFKDAPVHTNVFQLISSSDDLEIDARYIIVNTALKKALLFDGTSSSTGDVTISNNQITVSDNATIFTLGGSSGSYTFKNGANTLINSNSTTLRLNSDGGNDDKWAITFNDINAFINHTLGTSVRYIRYLSSSEIFRAYTQDNNYNNSLPVQLYKEVEQVSANEIFRVIQTNGDASNEAGGWFGDWSSNCSTPNGISGNHYTVTAPAGATVQFKAGTNSGYKILENNVSAVDASNNPITLTTVSSDDSGITFSFTMPASAVTITANFITYIPDVYFLSGDLSNWDNGTKMTYNSTDKKYTLRVYFSDSEYGFFRFRAGDTPYAANGNGDYWPISKNGSGESHFGDVITLKKDKTMRFRVPAGIYDIEVGQFFTDNWWDETTLKVTKVEPTLTFNPVAGTVASGQVVTVSSDLYSLLHAIDSNVQESAVSNQVRIDGDYAASIALTADATVIGRAKYGNIEQTDTALYTVVNSYIINCTATPEGTGTVTADKETATAGEIVTLTVTPANSNYEVVSVTVNGEAITPENGVYSFEMPAGVANVVATFAKIQYTITKAATNCTINITEIAGEAFTGTDATAGAGDVVKFTVTPVSSKYTIKSVTVTWSDGTTGTVQLTDNGGGNYQFNMVAHPITITAVCEREAVGDGSFVLVTDASTLNEGDKIIITNSKTVGDYLAMSTTQNGNNRSATDITIVEGLKATPGESVQILSLESAGTGWYLYNVNGNESGKYLYNYSGQNYLRSGTDKTDNYKVLISISSGVASIEFQASPKRYLKRNGNLFSCYTSGQSDVYIYKQTAAGLAVDIDPAGGEMIGSQEVVIDANVEGAMVQYKIGDGDWSTPAAGPVTTTITGNVGDNVKVYAKATLEDDGETLTDEADATFTFIAPDAPTINPASGSMSSETQNVTITSDYADGIIEYSTDGGATWNTYMGAFHVIVEGVGESVTVQARVTVNGVTSETATATYTRGVQPVVFSPASGTYYDDQTCQMFSTSKNARIYYTTDGSEPSKTNGTLYTDEVSMFATGTYQFKAVAYIGNTASTVSSANYNIRPRSEGTGYNENYLLFNVAELNAMKNSFSSGTYQTDGSYTMVNPVQVVWMSTYKNVTNGYPEYCLIRDNTGYGMIYFGKNNSSHAGYKIFDMGDWISGGYNGKVSLAYSQDHGQLDTHPELGASGSTGKKIYQWPESALSNASVLPEYLTIPEILSSNPNGEVDYWGHYVHLRKNTVQLIASDDPGTYTTGQDKDGKWSGTITDENGNQINYYDKFYLQIDSTWTTTSNFFTGHPNRTFDIYGFVACHLPAEIDYQIAPFAFAWIDQPICDHETGTYTSEQTVKITSPNDLEATIWYKTSEMDDYHVYTGPITVNSTTTIEWYATKQSQYNDVLESKKGEITMTFQEIPVPVITPESEVFAVGSSVDASIAFADSVTVPDGTVIRYTIDGSDPNSADALTYVVGETTLHFTATTTVRAIAELGGIYSAEAESKTYTFVKSNGIVYDLVTNVNQITENGIYVIVSQNYNEAMSNVQGETNRGAAGVMFVENSNKGQVYGNDDLAIFTVKEGNHEGEFLFETHNSNVNGFLCVESENNNTLLTEAEMDAMGNDVAVVTIDADGRAHIRYNYSGGDNRYLQYWNRDRYFTTYKTEDADRAVYIYYKNATPLASIEKNGTALPTTNTAENQYTVADQLIAVHYKDAQNDAGEHYLWCKDQGNVSIFKTEKTGDDQIDYLKDVTKVQNGDWDQSNWVVLKFTNPADHTTISGAVGKYISPATITGHYTDGVNFTITMPQYADLTGKVEDENAGFTPNVYCPANFLDANLNIGDGVGPQGAETGDHYFFMNPKVQEVATVTYAVWNGSHFVIPARANGNNQGNFDGAFSVGWDYNAYGDAHSTLLENTFYTFKGVLNTVSTGNGKSAKAGENANAAGTVEGKDVDPQPGKMVYALDLQGGAESPNIITAIKDVVDVTGKAVAGVKYYNLAGIESDRPFEGVNIIVTTYTDGSRSSSKVLK